MDRVSKRWEQAGAGEGGGGMLLQQLGLGRWFSNFLMP